MHTHTYMHTCTHANMRKSMCPRASRHTYVTSIHPSLPPSLPPSVRPSVHTYIHTYVRTHMRAYIIAYFHPACKQVNRQTCTHTCMPTCLHTYRYIPTETYCPYQTTALPYLTVPYHTIPCQMERGLAPVPQLHRQRERFDAN